MDNHVWIRNHSRWRMSTLARTTSAVFRVHHLNLGLPAGPGHDRESGHPPRGIYARQGAAADDSSDIVQERVIVPLNAIMGRHQLRHSSGILNVIAPGAGREMFHEKQVDYFDTEVSKRHCVVEVDEADKVRIRDLSSTNGTWISNGRSHGWERLRVGISYPLEPRKRIKLGEHSQYAYEYVGTTTALHVRVRYCCRHNSRLHDSPQHWEWMEIPADRGCWSTRELVDPERGEPLHGAPHFEVHVEASGHGGHLARVVYEEQRNHQPRTYSQISGSTIYGADLSEHDEYGEDDTYRVGYELLLPGPDPERTAMNTDHCFLRPAYLRWRFVRDAEGWPVRIQIDFRHVRTPPDLQTEVVFNQVRRQSTQRSAGRSLRHVITRALLERRLLDQATPGQEPGWISEAEIQPYMGAPLKPGTDFRNNLQKWRSDIANLLQPNAVELQKSMQRAVGIPQEVDWKDFLQIEQREDQSKQARLHPDIWVDIDGP